MSLGMRKPLPGKDSRDLDAIVSRVGLNCVAIGLMPPHTLAVAMVTGSSFVWCTLTGLDASAFLMCVRAERTVHMLDHSTVTKGELAKLFQGGVATDVAHRLVRRLRAPPPLTRLLGLQLRRGRSRKHGIDTVGPSVWAKKPGLTRQQDWRRHACREANRIWFQ